MMKKIVIPVDQKDQFYSEWGLSIQHFLFQINYHFYLILYPSYMEKYGHLDFKEDILKQALKAKCGKQVFELKRKYRLKEIKQDILSGIIFKSSICEVCHVYEDGARKEYCFYAKQDYVNYIESQFDYSNRYQAALKSISDDKVISDHSKKYLEKELTHLYFQNTNEISYLNEYEQLTLTELILKFSIKKSKKKNEKSLHKVR